MAALSREIIEPGRAPARRVIPDLVDQGVTAELVAALHHSVSGPSEDSLRVRIEWAGAVPRSTDVQSDVVVPSAASDLLESVGKLLRARREPSAELIVGRIVQMRDEGLDWGMASIETTRSGRKVEVDVLISGARVASAHRWFSRHEEIGAYGIVRSAGGRRTVMDAPRRLGPMPKGGMDLLTVDEPQRSSEDVKALERGPDHEPG